MDLRSALVYLVNSRTVWVTWHDLVSQKQLKFHLFTFLVCLLEDCNHLYGLHSCYPRLDVIMGEELNWEGLDLRKGFRTV